VGPTGAGGRSDGRLPSFASASRDECLDRAGAEAEKLAAGRRISGEDVEPAVGARAARRDGVAPSPALPTPGPVPARQRHERVRRAGPAGGSRWHRPGCDVTSSA
jgi:hypothetical protein